MNTASSLSIILPVLCGLLARKYLNKELRLLFILCILAVITELVSYKTALLLPENTEFLYYTTWIGIETLYFLAEELRTQYRRLESIIKLAQINRSQILSILSQQKIKTGFHH